MSPWRPIVGRTWAGLVLAAAAAALAVPAWSATASGATVPATELPPTPPPLPEVTFPLLRIFGALAFVLALFAAGAWLFRNWQTLPGFSRGRHRAPARLRMLEMRSLGNRHALFVVAYDRERLLIASSPTGVTLLDRLPPADEEKESEPATEAAAECPVRFADALRRILPTV